MSEKKIKVRILEEKNISTIEAIPPNFHSWFFCEKMWNQLHKSEKS